MSQTTQNVDINGIKNWRSIITLVVFVVTNVVVLFPFHIRIFLPRPLWNGILDILSGLRIIPPRRHYSLADDDDQNGKSKPWVRLMFPMNFVTAPLIADLFLLALLAIGGQEVHDGTIGADGISPIDIMVFFLTLAYIAISIDASGLIRYLAFKVLQKGGKVGHRLFFYLYAFFFSLGSFIGNDPIILSGTAFLAYMTRVSSNIVHPRAWIFTQFAVANIASAILVSSNPTNLVLSGAFGVKYIHYTANMIVPVFITAIVLFPFLLYIVFADPHLIPLSIEMHELSEQDRAKKPVNPNIPNARGNAAEEEKLASTEEGQLLSLEEIMNPFVDKGGAAFGAVIMATTLITLLVVNAVSSSTHERPVFWVTLPAAFIMFCWDIAFGWIHRHETREIARKGREEVERARIERALRKEEASREAILSEEQGVTGATTELLEPQPQSEGESDANQIINTGGIARAEDNSSFESAPHLESSLSALAEKQELNTTDQPQESGPTSSTEKNESPYSGSASEPFPQEKRATLKSLVTDFYHWAQETFPTVTAVIAHLPFALVPFAFSMFVLVQALVTKGWVAVFAHGWDHWVNKTGTVGSIGGMGFLSVILCNFAGTNIGTTILLSRVIQAWEQLHINSGIPISERTFWGTVYGMALGVNYGAFSTAFSASLAGLLWRDILARKHIRVRRLDFARINLPIIAIAMAVGCTVLVGEIYITRGTHPYNK